MAIASDSILTGPDAMFTECSGREHTEEDDVDKTILHTGTADIVRTARDASLFDWLMAWSRAPRKPGPPPIHLYADIGLEPRERPREWSGWRPFGP